MYKVITGKGKQDFDMLSAGEFVPVERGADTIMTRALSRYGDLLEVLKSEGEEVRSYTRDNFRLTKEDPKPEKPFEKYVSDAKRILELVGQCYDEYSAIVHEATKPRERLLTSMNPGTEKTERYLLVDVPGKGKVLNPIDESVYKEFTVLKGNFERFEDGIYMYLAEHFLLKPDGCEDEIAEELEYVGKELSPEHLVRVLRAMSHYLADHGTENFFKDGSPGQAFKYLFGDNDFGDDTVGDEIKNLVYAQLAARRDGKLLTRGQIKRAVGVIRESFGAYREIEPYVERGDVPDEKGFDVLQKLASFEREVIDRDSAAQKLYDALFPDGERLFQSFDGLPARYRRELGGHILDMIQRIDPAKVNGDLWGFVNFHILHRYVSALAGIAQVYEDSPGLQRASFDGRSTYRALFEGEGLDLIGEKLGEDVARDVLKKITRGMYENMSGKTEGRRIQTLSDARDFARASEEIFAKQYGIEVPEAEKV